MTNQHAIPEQEPDSIASLPKNVANTLARHGMVNFYDREDE